MFKLSSTYENTLAGNGQRVQSIDVLRGILLALMMLDHTREFFHLYAFDYNPSDLEFSTPIVFYTHWITNICAPAFIFLTGISAYLYRHKNHADDWSFTKYLLLRGIILIIIDLSLGQIAHYFYLATEFTYAFFYANILWSIGWGMIALSVLIYLPRNIVGIVGLVFLFFHNFFDGIEHQSNLILEIPLGFLHHGKAGGESFLFFEYPIIPVIGIIALGYYVGRWYTSEYLNEVRIGYLFYIGIAAIAVFVSLRFFQFFTEQYSYVFYLNHKDALDIAKAAAIDKTNSDLNWRLFFKENLVYLLDNYGDPSPWRVYDNVSDTVMSFFNPTRIPMSLLYCLMTLGPTLILLSWLDLKNNFVTRIFEIFGRVPLFFYLVHFILLNIIFFGLVYYLNSVVPNAGGPLNYDWNALLKYFNFSIPAIYMMTLGELFFMFIFCYGYATIRKNKKHPIFTYL